MSINDVSTDILGWEIQIDSAVHCGAEYFVTLVLVGLQQKKLQKVYHHDMHKLSSSD